MANTTTFAAIRDAYGILINRLTPTTLADKGFHRPGPKELDAMIAGTPTAQLLRGYRFMRSGDTSGDSAVLAMDLVERVESADLVVAYPRLPELYGRYQSGGHAGLDDLEDTMRADARQLRDLLTSTSNLISGQIQCEVTIKAPDRSAGAVWVQTLGLTLNYYEAQSI